MLYSMLYSMIYNTNTFTYPLRKTSEVKKAVSDGRASLLKADGTVKNNKKSEVHICHTCYIS